MVHIIQRIYIIYTLHADLALFTRNFKFEQDKDSVHPFRTQNIVDLHLVVSPHNHKTFILTNKVLVELCATDMAALDGWNSSRAA